MLPSQNGTSTTSHLLPVTFSPWIPTASVHLNTYLEYLPTQLTYLPTYLAYLDLERMNNVNYTSMLCTLQGQASENKACLQSAPGNQIGCDERLRYLELALGRWHALGRTPPFFTSQSRVRPHLNTPWHVHSCHYLKTHVSKWHVKSNVKWRHQSSGTGISELPRAALALACKPWTKASTISPSPNRAFSSASTIEFSISIS